MVKEMSLSPLLQKDIDLVVEFFWQALDYELISFSEFCQLIPAFSSMMTRESFHDLMEDVACIR